MGVSSECIVCGYEAFGGKFCNSHCEVEHSRKQIADLQAQVEKQKTMILDYINWLGARDRVIEDVRKAVESDRDCTEACHIIEGILTDKQYNTHNHRGHTIR